MWADMTSSSHFAVRTLRRLFELAYGDQLVMEYLRCTARRSGGVPATAARTETPGSDDRQAIYHEMWGKPL
jgi:hypothetical protein